MERRNINPWQWQDNFGYSQGVEVTNAERTIYLAGQCALDNEGNLLHAGDMTGQIEAILDNIETVLTEAGMTLSNIVTLKYYTTDVQEFTEAYGAVLDRLKNAGIQPATTLLGVSSLFTPDVKVEIEAVAAQ